MTIEELIQKPVITLAPTATCVQAAELMRDQNVGSVVVAEGDEPLGIVTDRDLALRIIAEQREPSRVLLQHVMSHYPVFLRIDRSLDDAIRTMREMRVRRLPIVNRSGHLEGMLSMDDVLMAIGRQLGSVAEAIATELMPREGTQAA